MTTTTTTTTTTTINNETTGYYSDDDSLFGGDSSDTEDDFSFSDIFGRDSSDSEDDFFDFDTSKKIEKPQKRKREIDTPKSILKKTKYEYIEQCSLQRMFNIKQKLVYYDFENLHWVDKTEKLYNY